MVNIIAAEPFDAAEIIALQRLAYQSEAKLYNDWRLPALTQTVDSLLVEFENSMVLKAVVDNRIIGSVRAKVENDMCKIGRLIVHPEFQNRGIGSCLLEDIEKIYSDVNCFELFTGIKSVNNIRFYEKHGYVISFTQALSEVVTVVFLVKPSKSSR